MKRLQLLWILGLLVAASGCVTEPARPSPEIPVSDEIVRLDVDEVAPPVTGGVGLLVADNESDSLEHLVELPGVRVSEVTPGGTASRAGLRVNDVILTVNGVKTDGREAFDSVVTRAADGASLKLQVRRNTLTFETLLRWHQVDPTVTPVEVFRIDPLLSRAGYRSVTTGAGEATQVAAEVVELYPHSPLPAAEIDRGDVILALDGEPVGSAHSLVQAFLEDREPGDRITLTVRRASEEPRDVKLRLWTPGRRVSRTSFPILWNYHSSLERDRTRFTLLDLWLFSLFDYERNGGEREYGILFFRWGTGYGELQEELGGKP